MLRWIRPAVVVERRLLGLMDSPSERLIVAVDSAVR